MDYRFAWRSQVQEMLGGIVVLRRPYHPKIPVIALNCRTKGAQSGKVRPQDFPVKMNQKRWPFGILQQEFLFELKAQTMPPALKLTERRRTALVSVILAGGLGASFGEGAAWISTELAPRSFRSWRTR